MKRFLVVFVCLVAGCSDKTYGEGLGRPVITPVVRPTLVGAAIQAVYAGRADAEGYVELVSTTGSDVALSGYFLCSSTLGNCRAVSDSLEGVTLAANGTPMRINVADFLMAQRNFGEVALIDPQGFAQSYLAWGGDPRPVGLAYVASAQMMALPEAATFVALPYPMPESLAVVHQGDGDGCITSTALSTSVAPCPAATRVLQLTEVQPSRFDAAGLGWVELQNLSGATLDLFGIRLCHTGGCEVVQVAKTVEAGALAQVSLVLTSVPDAGELLVLAPGSASPTDFVGAQSYVRWGEADVIWADAAVGAGLWESAAETVLPVRLLGESLSANPNLANSSLAWFPAQATPGVTNLEISEVLDTWDSCSAVRPWRETPAFGVVVTQVQLATESGDIASELLLSNRGDVDVDLATIAIEQNGLNLEIPRGDGVAADAPNLLAPGATRTLLAPALADVGEVVVSELVDTQGMVRQYLRWGTAEQMLTARTSEAVGLGIWPLERCTLPTLEAGTAVTLTLTLSGHAPPDYQ